MIVLNKITELKDYSFSGKTPSLFTKMEQQNYKFQIRVFGTFRLYLQTSVFKVKLLTIYKYFIRGSYDKKTHCQAI